MPAVGAGKQQTKPPQDPQLFQAPGPFFLISLHHEGISVTAQLRALGKQEGGFSLRASTPDITFMVWALPAAVVPPPPLYQHLWFGEETGKQNELGKLCLA